MRSLRRRPFGYSSVLRLSFPIGRSLVLQPLLLCIYLFLVELSLAAVLNDTLLVGFNGSRYHFVDASGAFLRSANDTFRLVFRSASAQDTERFYVCVLHFKTDRVVWVANRNLVVGFSDPFVFGKDGNVVLYQSGTEVWSTGTNSSATTIQLQETGNLQVLSNSSDVLWQSFDHPTDTLMLRQKFNTGTRLVGSASEQDPSEGSYSLALLQGEVNDLVLLAKVSPEEEQAYWSMRRDTRSIVPPNVSGIPSFVMLEGNALGLYTAEGAVISRFPVAAQELAGGTFPKGVNLREDGSLQAFYFENRQWADDGFSAPGEPTSCKLPGTCGPYGICTDGQCSCPDLFVQVNSTNPFQGCHLPASTRGYQLWGCTSDGNSSANREVEWLKIISSAGGGLSYFGTQFGAPRETVSLSDCQQLCQQDCSCTTLFYWDGEGHCYMMEHVATLQAVSDPRRMAFVKVVRSPLQGGTNARTISIICGVALVLLASLLVGVWLYRRKKAAKAAANMESAEDDMFLETIPGLPMRFSYKELDRATLSFSNKLGGGGFGSVYEGVLPDGSRVAVKKLESLGQGFKEFRAEVATIGSIHHLHLVQLRGFCAEGVHRLLVYEYLSNGSLDKSLFNSNKVLSWATRFDIALGTARGLAYLHEECREKIIHCDIKPENILLDDNYVAKVSDFGLAKLMNRELSQVFTTMRGTRGYLAPEWVTNYAITEKSDVFSFGMVLLEIVSGRKNCVPTETSEKWYFPTYAFRQLEIGQVTELVDAKLKGQVDLNLVGLVLRVALWCIQEDVTMRPSIGRVVQMLEGNIKVPNPPSSHHCFGGLFTKLVDPTSGSSSQSIHGFDGFGEYEGVRINSLSAERLSGPSDKLILVPRTWRRAYWKRSIRDKQ